MEANDARVVGPSLLEYIEALLVLMVASFGLLLNFASFHVIVRHHSFRNSFGYITAYHVFCTASILLICAVWATPWTLYPIPTKIHGLNCFLGQILLFFEEIAFHCSLLLAMNRFIAIVFPMKYRVWFTDSTTFWMLAFITALAGSYWGVYFVDGCDFCFSHDFRVWAFGTQPCSVLLSRYIDMIYNLCLFAVIAIIDIMTIIHLKSIHKVRKEFSLHNGDTGVMHAREKKEMLQFIQAFLTSCEFTFMLLCFHLISPHVKSEFPNFLCTTFVWELSHALEGFILVCFNPEIRRHFVAAGHFCRFLKDSLVAKPVGPIATTLSSPQK